MHSAVNILAERGSVREGQQLMRLVLETLPVGVAVMDQAGDIVLINEASKRIWGGMIEFGHERWAQTKGFWHESGERVGPKDWASVRALTNGETSLNELIDIQTYDGQRKIMRNSAVPVRNAEGVIVGAVIVNEDVTDRVQAVEALRRSEDELRLVIDTIPVMAWTLRPDGVVDFVSQRWLDYAGLSFEEAIADPMRTVHPEDVSRVTKKWLEDMAAGEPSEDEIRLRRADGKFRWFLIRTAPLRDDRGNIVKWFGSSIEIEDRKRAEDALRQSEFDLAEAQRVAQIGSWTLDTATDAVRWSDEVYRIFDVEKTAFASTHEDFISRIHPEDRARVSQVNAEAKSSGKPFAVDYRIITRRGQLKEIRELGFARKDDAGNILGLFGTAQDITERKRAQKDLEEAHRQLKILSRRRVKVQEEERRHLARELHDEIGQALTAAKINLQSAARDGGRSNIPRLHETIAILDRLVGQVRQISLDLRPSMLDDLGLVPALRSLLDQQGRRASIKVRFSAKNVPENLDQEIQTTCFRIAQETITNAVRHADATKIDVDLTRENGNLRLRVRDNGRGFDAERVQAQSAGLGLVGMRERAFAVGGQFEIKSAPGKGTEVIARFPVSSAPEPR